MEKWSSRCGWSGEEWDEWYQNAIQFRRAEQEFWEKAQERVVREHLVKKANKKAAENAEKQEEHKEKQNEAKTTPKNERRKSVFKRMFRRSETTGAPAVAAAAA